MIAYTTNEFGLRQKDMDYMTRLFEHVPAIEQVIIYGSRATGNFEKGSDVDLAVKGMQVSKKDIARIHFLLEEDSPTLLWFDVLHYETIKNEQLKQQIDTYGKVIYTR